MNAVDINEKIKLSTSISDFSYFAPDQVLTAGQLNRLIQYLDYQDRATRAWLVGSGLICGCTHAASGNSITLEPGCALTSDGDLLGVPKRVTLTHTRPLDDDPAKYFQAVEGDAPAAFAGPGNIVELVSAEDAADDSEASELSLAGLGQHVLVLYLESYAREPEFCTGENCDNRGPIQHNTLRVLALPSDDVTRLDSDFSDLANQLQPVVVSRPVLNSGIRKLEGAREFQGAFTTSIKATREALLAELKKVEAHFESALAPHGFAAPPDWEGALPGGGLDPGNEIAGLLHYHGFYRDFSRAYREWRESLFHLRPGHCGIQPAAFPKHVLLGVVGRPVTCVPTPFRHRFYRSAAVVSCSDELDRARLLWDRLVAMASAFADAPERHTTAATSLSGLTNAIRITPSAACDRPLGEQSVPIFLGKGFDPPWDVTARLQCRFEAPLSYYSNGEAAFGFSLCERPFYRIEGHLGEPLDEVLSTLEKLRAHYNLAFNILAVQIEDDPERVRPLPWRFFDIESLFYEYRTDFKLRFRDVAAYSDKVLSSLQGDLASESPRVPETSKATSAIDAASSFRSEASGAAARLPKSFSEFATDQTPKSFLPLYRAAVDSGHSLTVNTYSYAGNLQFSPADRFVQPELPSKFSTLWDLFKKRKRKAAELTVFQKFVEQHPGLEHLGGVPKGGTFVLVYSTPSGDGERIVKADLALPYFCALDLNRLEDEGEPADFESAPTGPDISVYQPPKWTDFDYTWNVAEITPPVLDQTRLTLEGQITTLFETERTTINGLIDEKIGVYATGIDSKFDFLSNVIQGRTVSGGGLVVDGGGRVTGGVLTAENFGDYLEDITAIEARKKRIVELQSEIEAGSAAPTVKEELVALEREQAEAIVKVTGTVGKNVSTANAAGRSDTKAIAFLQDASADLQTTDARRFLSQRGAQTIETQARTPLARSHLTGLGAIFGG